MEDEDSSEELLATDQATQTVILTLINIKTSNLTVIWEFFTFKSEKSILSQEFEDSHMHTLMCLWSGLPCMGYLLHIHSFIHSFIHSTSMCRIGQFLAILRSFFHSSLLCTFSCNPSPPTILPSSLTSSCHLILGLTLKLVVPKFIYNTLLGILFSSILSTCPKQHNLFNLIVSIIVGFLTHLLHILSQITYPEPQQPYILLKIIILTHTHTHTKHMLPHDNNAVFINILNILRIE